MYASELLRELQVEFEKDLTDRRIKNDSKDLSVDQTSALRGEITYIKNVLSRIQERITKGNL